MTTDLSPFKDPAILAIGLLTAPVYVFFILGCLRSIWLYFRWLHPLSGPKRILLLLANLCVFAFPAVTGEQPFTSYPKILTIGIFLCGICTAMVLILSGLMHGMLIAQSTVLRICRLRKWQKALLMAVPLDLVGFWLLRG